METSKLTSDQHFYESLDDLRTPDKSGLDHLRDAVVWGIIALGQSYELKEMRETYLDSLMGAYKIFNDPTHAQGLDQLYSEELHLSLSAAIEKLDSAIEKLDSQEKKKSYRIARDLENQIYALDVLRIHVSFNLES